MGARSIKASGVRDVHGNLQSLALASQPLLSVFTVQVYGEHYKLAIYVTPSRCDDEVCNSGRVRLPAAETMPCRQPLDMPTGFLDSAVPKNQTLNFTILALEDVLLKVRRWRDVPFSSLVGPLLCFYRRTHEIVSTVLVSPSFDHGRRKSISCMGCSRLWQRSSETPPRLRRSPQAGQRPAWALFQAAVL